MLRGFQEPAFGQRWRWSTVICWAVVALGLLLAWVPTRVREPGSDTCWAGILEYAFPWADLGLVVSFCLLISFVAVALGITFRMLRAHRLGAQERAEASQMVYYLVLGIVGYVSETEKKRIIGTLSSRRAGLHPPCLDQCVDKHSLKNGLHHRHNCSAPVQRPSAAALPRLALQRRQKPKVPAASLRK